MVRHIPADTTYGARAPGTSTDAGRALVRRRRVLGWLMAGAAAAFAGAFALPAVALKSLSVPKAGVEKGDILVAAGPWYEYLEPVRQAPLRFAFGIGLLAYLGMLFVPAYYDTLGLNLWQAWLVTLSIPVLGGASAYRWARWSARRTPRFDPTGTRRQLRTGG